jgi:hypothetical protein
LIAVSPVPAVVALPEFRRSPAHTIRPAPVDRRDRGQAVLPKFERRSLYAGAVIA